MPMSITKESYQDLKPYWDFQRKIQFNKENIRAVAEQFENRAHNEFGAMSAKDLFEMFWHRCTQADYDEPHPNWIPEDNHTLSLLNCIRPFLDESKTNTQNNNVSTFIKIESLSII